MHELPQSASDIIERQLASAGDPAAAFSAGSGRPPWAETATEADYDALAAVSEYASWVLAHGYALNHMTMAVHRLRSAANPGEPAFRCVAARLSFAIWTLSCYAQYRAWYICMSHCPQPPVSRHSCTCARSLELCSGQCSPLPGPCHDLDAANFDIREDGRLLC